MLQPSNSEDHGLSQWSREYLAALGPQKEPRAALQLETLMLDAGFTDVEVRLIPLPMCPWPSGTSRSSAFEEL